jgi:hypothetical protein
MIILPANTISGGYDVANSCRFNDGDSAYMHKTPGGSGNRKTFTFSFWIKRSNLGAGGTLFTAGAESDTEGFFAIYFVNADNLRVTFNESSSQETTTNAVFRDVSAWYHIVVAVDTEQGTAANRVKIYVNGTQVSSFSGENYPSEDYECLVSNTNAHRVGAFVNSSGGVEGYFDGYMAEVVFIDGLQLAATSFGEFDEDSPTIWKPIDVSGLTFGTNGFYLDFEDSSNLGNDANSGTDLTEVNLAATDQTTDTPTNNFCTLMSNDPSASNFTLSEGNLVVSKSGAATVGCFGSSIMLTKGKWYYESVITDLASGERSRMGVAAYESVTGTSTLGASYSGFEFTGDTGGRFSLNVAGSQTEIDGFNTYAQDDIIMWGIDMDNSKLYIGKNGDWFNYSSANTGGDPTSGSGWVTNNTTILAAPLTVGYVGHGTGASDSTEVKNNFGNPPFAISSGNADGNGYGNFEYAPPSGFLAICTKNLGSDGG